MYVVSNCISTSQATIFDPRINPRKDTEAVNLLVLMLESAMPIDVYVNTRKIPATKPPINIGIVSAMNLSLIHI